MPTIAQSLFSALTRNYPLYSGAIRFANHSFFRNLGRGDELVWAKVKGGEVLCNLNDLVGRTAFYTGDLDPKISWICARIVKPGDTVLDIGANVGIISLWLAKLVGKHGRVHAFEPNPELQVLLSKTIERNRANNIILHPVALGPESGEMQLRVLAGNTGSGSLIMDYEPGSCQSVTVPIQKLDTLIEAEAVKAIRLIKIDVEGFEAEVFRGALRVLASVPPQAILFEFTEKSDRPLIEESVFRILQEANYVFFAIPKCRFRMHLKPFDPKRDGNQGFTDFLAVQNDSSLEEIARAVRSRA